MYLEKISIWKLADLYGAFVLVCHFTPSSIPKKKSCPADILTLTPKTHSHVQISFFFNLRSAFPRLQQLSHVGNLPSLDM